MKLTLITTEDPPCGSDDCPAVYLTDSGTIVVQGDAVAAADGLRLGPGEQAVEISADLLREASRALGR